VCKAQSVDDENAAGSVSEAPLVEWRTTACVFVLLASRQNVDI